MNSALRCKFTLSNDFLINRKLILCNLNVFSVISNKWAFIYLMVVDFICKSKLMRSSIEISLSSINFNSRRNCFFPCQVNHI